MKRAMLNSVGRLALCLTVVGGGALPLRGNINLEFRPAAQTGEVTGLVEVVLYAVSDDPVANQYFSAMDVIIAWDPDYLELVGDANCAGCPGWLLDEFTNDPYGINETIPPQDGDGIFTVLAPLGAPVAATPAGTPIITFQFTGLTTTSETLIAFLESAGDPLGHTVVYDGAIPGLAVTGVLGDPAAVEIICQLCPGDVTGNGEINIADLAELLAHYGTASGALPSDGDLDCDGDVQIDDLAMLLSVYGTSCD